MSAGVERLVYMANQISRFFESQPTEARAAGVADHLRAFWDPRMRQAILAHLRAGGEGLTPLSCEAVRLLESPPADTRAALALAGAPSATRPGDDAG